MTNRKRTNVALGLVAALTLAMAAPVPAASLAQAKAQGLVGEQMDGYLGIVQANPAPDVRALVSSINQQRRAEYARIAGKNGVSPADVARIAAEKVIGQSPPGYYVQTPAGWRRR